MDKQPVGQLPDLTQSNNDDEIMVITNDEYNQLKKEKISDFITDLTSTDENNAIVKGTDGKLFTKDFGNASNITEGTLPVSVLPDIPKNKLPDIEITDLPESGVTADTYAYPSSVTVNAQGMVTAIAEGTPSGANADTDLSNLTPAGEKHFLNKTQITNCILSAPNGVATYSGSTITVKQGLKVLIPNGRNADGTLNNIEHTVQSDFSFSVHPSVATKFLLWGRTDNKYQTTSQFIIQEEKPSQKAVMWLKPSTNTLVQITSGGQEVDQTGKVFLMAFCTKEANPSNTITSLTPYQPVELAKQQDIDGCYIVIPYTTVVSQKTYDKVTGQVETYDVSNYLPKDGNSYLVSTFISIQTAAQTGAYFHTWTSSSDDITGVSAGGNTIGNYKATHLSRGWTLIRPDRILKVGVSASVVGGVLSSLVIGSGYRKVR